MPRSIASRRRWDEHGFGLWCVDLDGACIGFTGLADPGLHAGTSRSAGGWRRPQWGHGYAPEAARAALAFGFGELGLDEIVSFTVERNHKSRRVMEKLGMVRDPAADFDHPRATGDLRAPRALPAAVRHLAASTRRLLTRVFAVTRVLECGQTDVRHSGAADTRVGRAYRVGRGC